MKKMKRIRMVCILFGSVLAAFLVPLAARAWLASPRLVEAPLKASVTWDAKWQVISQNGYTDGMHPYPAVAVVSPTVCIAWSRQVGDNVEYYDPYYRSSPQNGDPGQWGDQVDIQPALSITETTRVDVAVDDNYKPHFVWSEYTRTPSYTLYYSYTNATSVEKITETNDKLLSPAIAVSDDDKVHVVWSQESSIQYNSKDIGPSTSWGSSTDITSSAVMAIHSDIAVDSAGTAHVVWSEGDIGSADIFYANSSDGSVWSTPFEVSDDVSNDGRKPAIAVSGNNVYVAWCEFESLSKQWVRFRQSNNKGASGSWSPYSENISGGPLGAHADVSTYLCPAIAVDSNEKIHVAFNGLVSGGTYEDIYYASKTQIGSWLCCRNLTSNVIGLHRNNTTPDIAAGGEDVHLVWAGPPPPPPFDPEGNDYEVLYKRTVTLGEGVYLPIIMKSY
ncbi:MAG: hypothetical protein E3J21_02050 [Anaerolineales bacterium]|nr:MAG: hypothetical protein E3J21_02050 [Anaerolineales bacterium]